MSVNLDMEHETKSIHACFPPEMEGHSGSAHDELRESTKLSRDSTSSGCFGWVRKCFCVTICLDTDEDSDDENYPETTGDGTKHSRDCSTGGYFEWIRRWVREKVYRNSEIDPESPANGDGVNIVNDEGDCDSVRNEGDQRGFSTDADYTLQKRQSHCSELAVELALKGAEEKQEETENEVSGEGDNAQTLSLGASELKEMEHSNAREEQVSQNSEIAPNSPATGDGVNIINEEEDCASVSNEGDERGFSTDADYTLQERQSHCSELAVELALKGAEEEHKEAENEVSGEGDNAQTLSLGASELKEMEPSNASEEQVSQNSEIAPNSPATGDRVNKANDEGDCASVRNEGDQRGFSTDADYTLHERETHCSVLAVELGLKGAEKEQEEAENEVSGEGGNEQTLSLQASELKEMEPSNASEEEVQTELGLPKTDGQMKKLEKENRRVTKILINLTEERGQKLEEKFEPLSMQDALCQKNYMRRIKKQSSKMEDLIKSLRAMSLKSEIDPNSPATGDGVNIINEEEDCASVRNEGDQRGFSTDADYTLHERETHCSVLAVELGLKGAEKEQEEAENEVSGEGDIEQTLSLQASELKEMEPSNASEEEVQTELGLPKTDGQMKKLEKENRRVRKILINLTEERGQKLEEKFEPLSMQDALCQKNYMRRIKKQSSKMEDLIKSLRAMSFKSEIDPNSPATGDGVNIINEEEDCASVRNEGDQRGFSTDADYTLHERETHCSVLAVELGLKGAEKEQEEAENEVSGEGDIEHTLSLQPSELKEMEPSNASEEEVQTELGLPKTDGQMKKLEKENRRVRKILINLTEERGQKLEEKFEPLSMQDALCQKNYMRRIKKQSSKMEDLIKSLRAMSFKSEIDPNSPATGDGVNIINEEEDCASVRNEGDQRGFSTDADYTLHERETHCSVLAVELGLKGAEKEQEEAENEVSGEGDNEQTLSLQASELKEMEPSNASEEEVQTELGLPKTDGQMKKLEKENRRVRKILINLTEERGQKLEEKFEPLSMQDALCQKNYMRRIKKQSSKMEDLIKSLRAMSFKSEIDPNSPATGDGVNIINEEEDCASVRNEGDQRGFSTDADYTLHERETHCSVLAVELGLKGAEKEQEEAENEVSGEGDNEQTLSLQASELKEMEPSNASEEEVQTELGLPKTDGQMKKLEKENRRVRKILINLTEERGQKLEEKFEPLSMQDALCQKNYMRRIKKQSSKMEDLIKSLRAMSFKSEIDPNSPATGDGVNIINEEEDCASVRNEGDQRGFSTDADYTLHERETHCSVLAVELGLKGAEKEQEEAENEVSGEGDNEQTLSLQASELKEMEPSNASEEEVQTELGLPKTDGQMKKLEKENRRVRKILINLTEERGQKLEEKFEPLSMQDALCQKNYMRRIKKQSSKMEDLIKSLRAEQQLDI